MAVQRASRVLAAADLRMLFSLAKTCSMGLRSHGEWIAARSQAE